MCGVSEVTCGVSEVTCGFSEVTCGVSVPDYTSHSQHVLCTRYSRGGQSRAPGYTNHKITPRRLRVSDHT